MNGSRLESVPEELSPSEGHPFLAYFLERSRETRQLVSTTQDAARALLPWQVLLAIGSVAALAALGFPERVSLELSILGFAGSLAQIVALLVVARSAFWSERLIVPAPPLRLIAEMAEGQRPARQIYRSLAEACDYSGRQARRLHLRLRRALVAEGVGLLLVVAALSVVLSRMHGIAIHPGPAVPTRETNEQTP